MHFYLHISALLLYYWLTNLLVHPWISCFLSFLCICFSSVSVLFSPTCLFCIVCWFHLFRLYIVYLLIIPFSAELILYRRRFVYLLIYWLCSIHLSLYFCTHFVLFSHLSTHLFIYRLFVRLFFFPFIVSYLLFMSFSIFEKSGLNYWLFLLYLRNPFCDPLQI